MTARIAVLLLLATQYWADPSPHQTRLITVEPGVQLEVLDWGGTGPPLVLLAGYLSAHAYDERRPNSPPLTTSTAFPVAATDVRRGPCPATPLPVRQTTS